MGGLRLPAGGANRRWRCYRYAPGERFFPHFDAAWPEASIEDDQLVHDARGEALSFYTLLVYLNDGFAGGATRLYDERGAVDVVPATGGALLFPHGHHPESVFHEGREVTRGAKFVLRTDVLFSTAAASEASLPPAPATRSGAPTAARPPSSRRTAAVPGVARGAARDVVA